MVKWLLSMNNDCVLLNYTWFDLCDGLQNITLSLPTSPELSLIGPPPWHRKMGHNKHKTTLTIFHRILLRTHRKHTHAGVISSPPQNTHPHHRCHAHPQYNNKKTGVPTGLYHPSSTIVFSASHKLLLKIYYRNGAICYRGMTSTPLHPPPHNHVRWCLTMGCSCVYSYFELFTYFLNYIYVEVFYSS